MIVGLTIASGNRGGYRVAADNGEVGIGRAVGIDDSDSEVGREDRAWAPDDRVADEASETAREARVLG